MTPSQLIAQAESEGRKTLTEAESKELLAAYGLPVVKEIKAADTQSAVAAAREIGFPVVVKGLGHKLTHKTERGLVRLNLTGPAQVEQAAREIEAAAGPDLEGFLVQPQLAGQREFVAGLFRDPLFGPVLMFGLGGVFTEALSDVVFRLAPLDPPQVEVMLDELRSRPLLDEFRGQKPADRSALIRTLVGLSHLGMEHPEVAEVDVNPLMVTPAGQVLAVDALVVLGQDQEKKEFKPPLDPAEVGRMFHPRSVAFIGVSAGFRKWGYRIFTNVVAGGYQGDIYLVNPKGEPIAGRKVYKSVTEIPGQVDLAVITIPADKVMALLPELAAKGIKKALLITSGFAETGPEGRRLEDELVAEARRDGLLILGPNTMGICNPHRKFFCLGSHARPEPGSTAFVSQSGNMGVQLLTFAAQQGIGIRAFGGSGNEAMFTIEDALDAFEVDELTNTVLLYIESVKNGRRFFESARRVSRKKPVVVLKGGRTKAGSQAAASHTGALASNIKVFDAACSQAGIILAGRSMDLLDLSAAFSSLPLPKGPRAGIMTLGGGWGVVTADLCSEFGVDVPPLSRDLIELIDEVLPPYWSRSNPVDIVGETDPSIPLKVMEALAKWDGCDVVLNLGIVGRKLDLKRMIQSSAMTDPQADLDSLNKIMAFMTQYESDYIEFLVRLMEKYHKPIVGVSLLTGADEKTVFEMGASRYKGIFFPTPERAVKVVGEMCQYSQWLIREGVSLNERNL